MKKNQINRLKRQENIAGWLFIAPALTVFLALTLVPFLMTLVVSFLDWNFLKINAEPEYVGLYNFVRIFEGKNDFLVCLQNTFVYVFTIVPLSIILSLVFAFCMNDKIYGKKALRMMFFAPYICSVVAVGAVFKFLFRDDGIINTILMNAGIISQRIKWNIDPDYTKIPIILLSVWVSIGYQLILFTAAMQNVPTSLYEASKIDGANSFHQFTRITLPMISPTIFYLVITRIMAVFKIFGSVNIFTLGTSLKSNKSMVVLIYELAFKKYEFGEASAMSMLLFILILIVTGINFWGQKKWVHY